MNAQYHGCSVVREPDLLWAMLENPSGNVRRVMAAAGCEHGNLLEELGKVWEKPGERTDSRYFVDGDHA
jgi:hypothetical protein